MEGTRRKIPLNTGQGFVTNHSNEHFDGPHSVPRTIQPCIILLWLESILFCRGSVGAGKMHSSSNSIKAAAEADWLS